MALDIDLYELSFSVLAHFKAGVCLTRAIQIHGISVVRLSDLNPDQPM